MIYLILADYASSIFFWPDTNLSISPRYPNEFDHTYTYVWIVLIYNIIFSTVWIFGGVDRWWNLPHFCHHCSSSFILCPKFLASQKEIFPKPYAYQWTDHGNSLFTQLCMKISGHRVHVDELACLGLSLSIIPRKNWGSREHIVNHTICACSWK